MRKKKQEKQQNFNPRSRKGSDRIIVLYAVNSWISIHAPARGATVYNKFETIYLL